MQKKRKDSNQCSKNYELTMVPSEAENWDRRSEIAINKSGLVYVEVPQAMRPSALRLSTLSSDLQSSIELLVRSPRLLNPLVEECG